MLRGIGAANSKEGAPLVEPEKIAVLLDKGKTIAYTTFWQIPIIHDASTKGRRGLVSQEDDSLRIAFPEHSLPAVPLSQRLQVILGMLDTSETLADIGTDHGYLAVAAYEQGKAKHVVASDINEPPLHAARMFIAKRGLSHHVHARQGDGVQCYEPYELQQVVIAGMGGILMRTLLADAIKASPRCFDHCQRMVLQPMNHEMALRSWLCSSGWPILDECLMHDKGKLYQVIVTKPGDQPYELSWEQLFCGPVNVVKATPAVEDFVQRELRRRKEVLPRVLSHAGNEDRVKELENEISMLHRLALSLAQRN